MGLAVALYSSVEACQVRILRLLLTVDGEKGRSVWANTSFDDGHLLHFDALFCYPAAVCALLRAGADEAVHDSVGRIPRDVIGADLGRDGERQMDRGDEVSVRRMLQRCPVYRARSWAWPSNEQADASGSGVGDTAAAAAAAAIPSSPLRQP